MDTSDPDITFDGDGVCVHCREFGDAVSEMWHPGLDGQEELSRSLERMRLSNKSKEYDCVVGLSGGVDSSFIALKLKDFGLRALAVHVDTGWNSELSVGNIEKVVSHCGFDLHTHVVNWEEMRDLQLSYLKAAVSNQDVPQDHAIMANLFHFAVENGVKTVVCGCNVATEGIFPKSWHGASMDAINLLAIHRRYGSIPLREYRTISFSQYYFVYPMIYGLRAFQPLNYMPYSKTEAVARLEREVGWRPYARKHGESLFTKFFQNHYLPVKFGYDKRRPHLSSLIVSGQLGRDEALRQLEAPLYDIRELEEDIVYFQKKMRISQEEYESLMAAPIHHYSEFPSWDRRLRMAKMAQRGLAKLTGKTFRAYFR